MDSTNKVVATLLTGAALVAGLSYAGRLRRAQVQLQIIPSVSVFKMSMQGLTLRVAALLKNPTAASFTIKYPFIEVMHKGTLIGSSQVQNRDIEIPAFGQVLIPDMMVDIPVLNFFSLISDLILSLNNHEPVVLNVGVITTVRIGWSSVAYEHRQDLTLKY